MFKPILSVILGLTGYWLAFETGGPGFMVALFLVQWGNNIGQRFIRETYAAKK